LTGKYFLEEKEMLPVHQQGTKPVRFTSSLMLEAMLLSQSRRPYRLLKHLRKTDDISCPKLVIVENNTSLNTATPTETAKPNK